MNLKFLKIYICFMKYKVKIQKVFIYILGNIDGVTRHIHRLFL
jgi:hypothetical protein